MIHQVFSASVWNRVSHLSCIPARCRLARALPQWLPAPWLIALGLLTLLPLAAARAEPTPAYAALVAQVTSGSDADRRTFARVALEQMASSYETELARAGGADGRWRRYMQQEAERLRDRAARIDDTLRIALAQDGPDGVRLIIDGENVIIASPRLDAPERLEAAIVAEACLYLPCQTGDPARAIAASPDGFPGGTPPGSADVVREPFGPADEPAARTWPRLAVSATTLPSGAWYRLEGGGATYRSANGLNFQFREPAARQEALAALCERIAADFERLAAALAHAESQRWPLAWEFLRLGPALEGEQSVIINPLGDAFLLPLAEPAILDRLLPAAQAWLLRRARGETSQQYFPEADRLLSLTNHGVSGARAALAPQSPPPPAPPQAAPATPATPPGAAPATPPRPDWRPL